MSLYCPHCFSQNPDGMTLCRHCGGALQVQNRINQLPPMTILEGRYLVGVVLGEGGFGITYAGFDLRLQERVAIKEYYPSGLGTRISSHSLRVESSGANAADAMAKGREKFLEEARTMTRFKKLPSVVEIQDFFQANGTAYIVMEYLDGVSMGAWLKRHGPEKDFNRLYAMLSPVLRDLEKIHQAGLIHRDISPSNLMLLEDGTVKLLDFGTARDMSEEGERSLSVVLKHGFAPAEQYSRRGQQGAWTDIYALCATIYKLLTGLTPDAAIERQEEDRLQPPSQLGVSISRKQEQTLLRGLAVRRSDRIQTLSELMAGLEEKNHAVLEQTVTVPSPESGTQIRNNPQEQTLARQEADYQRACEREAKAEAGKKIPIIITSIAVAAVAAYLLLTLVILPSKAYKEAEALFAAGEYEAAAAAFVALENYKDAAERIPEVYYAQAETMVAEGEYEAAITAFEKAGNYKDAAERIPEVYYAYAEALLSNGNMDKAEAMFNNAGDYKDASTRMPEYYYGQAEKQLAEGNKSAAAMAFGKAGDYKDARSQSATLWNAIPGRNAISVGSHHTVGLRSDGTVVTTHTGFAVHGWKDIVSIASGTGNIVGLRSDGTVVATGNTYAGRCAVEDWTNIVAISSGWGHTVGLRPDGTVVATKYTGDQDHDNGQCEVSDWREIIAIAAGYSHTVGLRSDGTVVATEYKGNYYFDQCEVSGWTDIVSIAAGNFHTVGLRSNGTVVAVGQNSNGQCEVSGWTNIVAVAAGADHTIGLRADGTVVATRYTGNPEYEVYYDQCEVSGWTDIVAIAAGWENTMGLRSDGTVVAVGNKGDGRCNVSDWTDILVPQNVNG